MAIRYEDDENIIGRAFGHYYLGEETQNMVPATLQLTINGLYLFDRRRAESVNGVMHAHLDLRLQWQDFDLIGEGKIGEKRYLIAPYKQEQPVFTFISDAVSYRDMTTLVRDLKNIGIVFVQAQENAAHKAKKQ